MNKKSNKKKKKLPRNNYKALNKELECEKSQIEREFKYDKDSLNKKINELELESSEHLNRSKMANEMNEHLINENMWLKETIKLLMLSTDKLKLIYPDRFEGLAEQGIKDILVDCSFLPPSRY